MINTIIYFSITTGIIIGIIIGMILTHYTYKKLIKNLMQEYSKNK